MIIITGPGRSGTSVLALLYKELGFDPGGTWHPGIRAGLENPEFWRLNNKLAAAAGMTMYNPRKPPKARKSTAAEPPSVLPVHRRALRAAKRRLAAALNEPPIATGQRKPKPRPRVRLADWDRAPALVEKHRATMLQLAAETAVVKDPRFLWTLPFWLDAGAQIDHVVITIRAMADMVASRAGAGHTETSGPRWFSELELRNSMTYGLGVATAAIYDHDVSHSFIRFPDFVRDVDSLYESLRFPEPVSAARFHKTARRVFDVDQVNDYTPGGAAS